MCNASMARSLLERLALLAAEIVARGEALRGDPEHRPLAIPLRGHPLQVPARDAVGDHPAGDQGVHRELPGEAADRHLLVCLVDDVDE